MYSKTVQGIVGSFEVTKYDDGSTGIYLTYSRGSTSHVRTDIGKVEALWIEQLQHNDGWRETIPEGEGVEIVRRKGTVHIWPSYNGITYGNEARFNRKQVREIVRALRSDPKELNQAPQGYGRRLGRWLRGIVRM